jgi:UDP-galactopyranose mutase
MQHEHPIVVLSHLRWNFVYQRPQHLLSRLASRHRVLFVEEPEHEEGLVAARWERSRPLPNVTVYRPRTRSRAPGFHPEPLEEVQHILPELREDVGQRNPIAWVYTPMALPLVHRLEPLAVVYDCMDELSLFRGAPPELVTREADLLELADLVFTGGPSLHRAKRHRHPNIHCFPSSVDSDHFGRARSRRPRGVRSAEPADQDSLGRPRLGFYGVIDEHYFGQRTYGELPAYLGGWDVCLLPFALNEATRFISPTKTLEYMAAERPIVSTPITDVAEPYGDIVRLGRTPEEFVAACEAALAETEEERTRRVGRMREVLARTSWDATANAMQRLLNDAVGRRRAPDSTERTEVTHARKAV